MKDRVWKLGWDSRQVHYVPGPQVNDGDLGELFGVHQAGKKEILVNTDFDEAQQKSTTLHELLHAIVTYAGLALSEEQVTGLGNILYQVMTDNKKHFKELFK